MFQGMFFYLSKDTLWPVIVVTFKHRNTSYAWNARTRFYFESYANGSLSLIDIKTCIYMTALLLCRDSAAHIIKKTQKQT